MPDDEMNAFHAEMEHMMEEVPKQLLSDNEFAPMTQAIEASQAGARASVLSQDQAGALKAIGQLKGPYSRMFLRYG